MPSNKAPETPLIGISACLTGQRVRYDGQHKWHVLINTHIAPYVHFISVCPEAAIGMGIPRPPFRLEQHSSGIHAKGRDGPHPTPHITEALQHFGKTLGTHYGNLSGYIWQSRSPSCGYKTTPIYKPNSTEILRTGSGLVAGVVADIFSQQDHALPMINDNELTTAEQCKTFLQQVRQYNKERCSL